MGQFRVQFSENRGNYLMLTRSFGGGTYRDASGSGFQVLSFFGVRVSGGAFGRPRYKKCRELNSRLELAFEKPPPSP